MKIDGVGNLCLCCMGDMGNSICCPHCGHDEREPMQSEQAIPAGRIIGGHYLIGRTLGQGGFGITYLAYDLDLHIKRAIKEYFPQGLVTRVGNLVQVTRKSVLEVYQKGVESFYREAQSIAQFGGHPNVVQVHAFFRENNSAYFVMDYVEGISFQQYLDDRGGRISWEEALRILKPIGEALTALHEAHLLHRDVKPANIFITRNGTPKLLDFGAARYETSETTHSSAAVLTPGYAPVEQYGSMSRQGTFTDVYALSATFYRAVSGFVPIPAPDRMDQDPLLPLDKVDGRVPVQVGTALSHGMGVRRENRTQTVAELLKELETPRKPKSPKWLLPAILTGILLGVGLLKLIGGLNMPPEYAENGSGEEFSVKETLEAENAGTKEAFALTMAKPTEMQEPTADRTLESLLLEKTSLAETQSAWQDGMKTEVPSAPPTPVLTKSLITEVQNAQVGDHVLFGHYEQDNVLSNGAEAIEWRVLAREDNRLLLLSEYGLDAKPYNEKQTGITWEKCTLRKWLNEDFYESAFSTDEKIQIMDTEVKAEDNPIYSTNPGNDTQDRIYLLSLQEADIYFTNNTDRQCRITSYSISKGAYSNDGTGWWWLRSPGYYSCAANVHVNGSSSDYGSSVNYNNALVRPALWINLKNEDDSANEMSDKSVVTVSERMIVTVESVPEVITDEIRSAQVGDRIYYGHYEQDNNNENGVEGIVWRVLAREENRLLLLSEYGLDAKKYNEKREDITWEKSTLRNWMNRDFYENAFNVEEQKQIAITRVKAVNEIGWEIDDGNVTQDRIFLLSISESETYFTNDENHECKVTAYAEKKGAYRHADGSAWCWFRSPSGDSGFVSYSITDGSIDINGLFVNFDEASVRPALWLNL